MASNLSSSVYQTSDLIHDFACSPCKDDGLNNEAQFFCDQCRKYYCNNCVAHHNKLFRTHSVLGKQAVSKWVGYAGLSPIEICDKHGDKKLDMLCEDHDELGCYVCVSLTHRMCQSIKHIPDIAGKVKSTTEFKQFPSNVRLTSSKLQSLSDKTLQNKQSLKDAGKKILAEIKSLRKELNNTFDELETKTNTILQNQLHDADEFLQEDIDKCTQLHEKLRTFLEAIQSQQDDTSYIAYRKCKDKMREAESLIQELSVKPDTILTFHSDPRIEQFLYGLKTLGGTLAFPCKHSWKYIPTSHVFNVKNRSKSIVKMQSDVHECFIGGICELPGGEILITDMKNYKVKLLNSQYQVTATCD
ncbi:TRI33-like protein, partial [Mya arenaria]